MASAISKAYNSIKELPSEVRSSFDERDQKKWMDAYNEASQNEEPEQAKVDAWMSMVDAPSSLAVETWGSVEVRDADGELVPVDTIANYADKFIENGGLMHDSHSNVPVGTVWNWDVRKHPETGQDGIVFYFNIYRDGEVFERARDDILSGRKQAVSIGAEAPRGGYKCDDRGCYVERDVTDLYELSICETPANPEAYFINVGKDIAKAKQPLKGEQIRFGIKDVVVHQDYTTCPLQKCKKDILDKGFEDVHLTADGKIIAKSKTNEYELFKTISALGYPFRYDIKKEQFEIMPDYGVEQAIEEALGNDWAHEDNIGHVTLTRNIPKEVFIDWFDRGFIVKIGDNYCLKADDVAKGGSFENLTAESNIIWLLSDNPETRYSFEEIYAKISQSEPQISEADLKYALNELVKRPWHAGSWNIYRDGEEYFASENNLAYKKVKKNNDVRKYYYSGNQTGWLNSVTFIVEKFEMIEQTISNVPSKFWELEDYESMEKIEKKLSKVCDDITLFIQNTVNGFSNKMMQEGYVASSKKKVKKDGGAMGVGDAGASNPVYGSKPTSLVTPTGDKKYGKRRKAKKEMTDDRNIHGPTPTSNKGKSVKKMDTVLRNSLIHWMSNHKYITDLARMIINCCSDEDVTKLFTNLGYDRAEESKNFHTDEDLRIWITGHYYITELAEFIVDNCSETTIGQYFDKMGFNYDENPLPKAKKSNVKKNLPSLGNTVATVFLDGCGEVEISSRGQEDGKQYYGVSYDDFDTEFELSESGSEMKCTVYMIDGSDKQWIDEQTFQLSDNYGVIEFMKDYTEACWMTYLDA